MSTNPLPNSQAKSKSSLLPIDLFKSGQLLCLPPHCQGGLILRKRFYADFVGPGAAVGGNFDIKCISVYAIGAVEFYAPTSFAERAAGYQKRMAYAQKIREILLELSSSGCAYLLVNQLCEWLGVHEAKSIPNELVCELVGLSAKTVTLAWQHYQAGTLPQDLQAPIV